MSLLQISLLGVPVVKHGEQTLAFSTRKALALLVYLAVEGRTHTRKSLSEAFWPELDAEHGRAALRATLLELRKLFERSHSPGEQAHLLVERDTLALDQGNSLFLDLRLVEAASKQAGVALANAARNALQAQFEQAVLLARGPFLANFTLRDSQFFDDWTRQQREYWLLRMQQLFESLSHLYEHTGQRELAIDVVNRWLRFDPLCEEGYRRLMRLRFALGDRVGALRAYATCRTVLADELQVEPEPETMALAKRLRHTTPAYRSSLRPPDSLTGRPSASLLDSPLIARSNQFGLLIECYQHVSSGKPHLMLLQGESGIGKTRLTSEFVSWAQAQGATVLSGHVLQTGRQLPYQPYIDILRYRLEHDNTPGDHLSAVWLSELSRLLPELRDRYSDLPPPSREEELGHHQLFEAITRLIRHWAAHRPLVLMLDDMQWADIGTLDLFLYLARSLAKQPAPILLLLTLRLGTGALLDQQTTWLQALKRTYIPLTVQPLARFTKEETRLFVQALPWVMQSLEAKRSSVMERCSANGEPSSGYQEELSGFANWLYTQTQGLPFSLVETLKGLLEREMIQPSLQENGKWGMVLRDELLTQAAASELIPSSLQGLIRSQFCQLTSSARLLLVAAAVLRTGLTFERLCQVAQLEEEMGIDALEEIVRSGLLYEKRPEEEGETFDSYSFPGEMVREVVYQEAGATRQRLLQKQVRLLLQEEIDNNRKEESISPHPTPLSRSVLAKIS